MTSQFNEIGTCDKKFIEALFGDLGGNSIEVLHSHHEKYLIPSFRELYDEIEDLCDDEQISIRPTLCRDDYGTVVQYGQKCIWVSLAYKSAGFGDRFQPNRLKDTLSQLPCRPSAVVDTGHHIDAYWILTENLISVDRVNLAEWTMRWLSAGIQKRALGACDKFFDDAPNMFKRYMKVPGATNCDYPDEWITDLHYFHSDSRYSLTDLAHIAWKLTHKHWPQSTDKLIHPRLRHLYS